MTIILVILTSAVSIWCFYNPALFERLSLSPSMVMHHRQYWRIITHAFVHANWLHLIINMIVLFSFGQGIEYYFRNLHVMGLIRFQPYWYYLALYFSAIVVASLTTIQRYRDNYGYHAVGASGAVSAVLFACIFFDPWQKLLFWAVIPIPGIIFGILYLWYSHYMSRQAADQVNHDAHFWGALYGMSFPVILHPPLLYLFFKQLVTII